MKMYRDEKIQEENFIGRNTCQRWTFGCLDLHQGV